MSKKVDLLQQMFDCTGWDDVDFCVNQFYDATFKHDFGPFKKGTTVKCLMIDFIHGIMESLDNEGKVAERTCFNYTPTPSHGSRDV